MTHSHARPFDASGDADAPDVVTAAEFVSATWADVLDEEYFDPANFDPTDDFFALGGDSIAAARVAQRISSELKVHIPASALHQHPTFHDFVSYIESLRESAPVITPRSDLTTHPLDPGQQRLWLLSQLHRDQATYTVPIIIDMVGDLDRAALSDALCALTARHEPLRTIIGETDSGPVCRVLPPGPVPIEAAHADDEPAAVAKTAAFLQRPFALAVEVPIRALLLELSPMRHWLVLAIHHIATDGESNAIICDELGRLYNAAVRGIPAELAPLAITFGDIVAWRAAQTDDGLAVRLERQRAKLRGYEDRPLPLEGRQGDIGAGKGGRHRTWLDTRLTEAVRAFASTHRTTVFVTLMAAFAEVAARWLGSDDVCIGYPASVREPAAARELVGFFITTRVIRADVGGRSSFTTVVDRVHRAFVEAAVDDVPFDALNEAVVADRGHRGPLFRIWFNHLGASDRPPIMDGLKTSLLDSPVPPALFDLNVYVVEHDDRIRVDLVYDIACCSDEAGAEVLDQYVALLAAALADTKAPLRRHRLCTPRAASLPDPTDTLHTPASPPLSKRFAQIARERRTAVAVRDPLGVHTYGELRAQIAEAALALRAAGVRRGDTVAVHADRGCGLVTAMLAVWSAGARLMLLDPAYPLARLAHYVAVGRPRCLVVAGTRVPDLNIEAVVTLHHAQSPEVVRVAVSEVMCGQHLGAYLAFTSGSTGMPVGVVAELEPIEHFLNWYAAEHAIGPQDRFALLASVSHDPVFRDVLLPLWAGATLCIPAADTYRVPTDLARWLCDEQVTVAHMTPPLARLLIDTGVRLPALRLVCLAGDAPTSADVVGISKLAPAAVVINGYGTTETPQLASSRVVSPDEVPALGATVPGSQLLVINSDGALCGIGEPGQIVVRSRHLASCLLVPEGEPARLLVDDVPGVGRCVTGDIGRYQTDGSVAYLGRADDTVNIRGFRADPMETDRALGMDPRVSASATVSRTGPDGAELVSYVVATGVTASELRARLASLLPAYLVPTTIVFVDKLPLTVNGKVDRTALRTMAIAATRSADPPHSASRTSPEGPLEHRLARICQTVLGLEHIDVTDNFFDLGGTSLTMLRLHAAVKREVDDQIPLLALYQNPSVRALARSMAGAADTITPTHHTRGSHYDERSRRIAARRAHAALMQGRQ